MTPRSYTMTTRAAAADATRQRILDATVAIALETERLDFSLDDVAARSARSVQTVLRQFGSRDGLIDAAVAHGSARVAAERRPASAGDIPHALELLIKHYEQWGRFMLRLLARDEDQDARTITAGGQLLHREWVRDVFGTEADALTDLLVVATDLYTWKLLRLDRGLDPGVVLDRMTAMTDAVLTAPRIAQKKGSS